MRGLCLWEARSGLAHVQVQLCQGADAEGHSGENGP